MPETAKHKSVLYVGQCYYNHWFLSRELRKIGWKADQLNLEPSNDNSNYFHGEDFHFGNPAYQRTHKKLEFFLYALANYQYFHFANKNGLYFISDFDQAAGKNHSLKKLLIKIFFSVFI